MQIRSDVFCKVANIQTDKQRRLHSLLDGDMKCLKCIKKDKQLETWANAQRDGRPAEYTWRPLFNAAKFG